MAEDFLTSTKPKAGSDERFIQTGDPPRDDSHQDILRTMFKFKKKHRVWS